VTWIPACAGMTKRSYICRLGMTKKRVARVRGKLGIGELRTSITLWRFGTKLRKVLAYGSRGIGGEPPVFAAGGSLNSTSVTSPDFTNTGCVVPS